MAETLSGPIRVVDADTIDIGAPETIRLLAIDAAEGDQTCTDGAGAVLPCGAMATEAARSLYEGRFARCTVLRRDRYGRSLATCFVDGEDMNADLVRRGIARVYRSDATYFEEQKEAILLSRGLWAYDMVDPAQFRAQGRAAVQRVDGCAIKGNISANGRLYHVPGSHSYGRTRINTAKGERWFCTEAEARAAGWRAAR
ncbi:MAG: thermonuclease family protein [Pseudomonadota bacterium]